MEPETFHSRYYGIDIYRKNASGYYVVFIPGVGQLVADTLAGIKESIRDNVTNRFGK